MHSGLHVLLLTALMHGYLEFKLGFSVHEFCSVLFCTCFSTFDNSRCPACYTSVHADLPPVALIYHQFLPPIDNQPKYSCVCQCWVIRRCVGSLVTPALPFITG